MICDTCKKEGEEKLFTTFRYWYCNQCKTEIKDEPKKPAIIGFDTGAYTSWIGVDPSIQYSPGVGAVVYIHPPSTFAGKFYVAKNYNDGSIYCSRVWPPDDRDDWLECTICGERAVGVPLCHVHNCPAVKP